MKVNKQMLILFGILVIGAFLQLYKIGTAPLWLDEALSYYRGVLPISDILEMAYLWDVHPATYYTLLHFWINLGNSETMLRLLSMIFSFISLPVLYHFIRKTGLKNLALVATFFLSVSFIHIRYAQEVRSYSLFFLISLFAYFYYYLALKENKPRYWIFWAIFSILNFYVHYFSTLLIASQACWFFILALFSSKKNRYSIQWRYFLIAGCLIAVAAIPQLLFFFKQASTKTGALYWQAKNPIQFMLIIIKNFTYPSTLSIAILNRGLKYLLSFLLLLGNIFAWRFYKEEIIFHGFQFVFIMIIAWGSSFVVSIPAPFKYVIFVNIPLVLLGSLALFGIVKKIDSRDIFNKYPHIRRSIYCVLTIIFVVTLAIIYKDYHNTPRAEDWKSGAAKIQSLYQEGDVVIPIPTYSDYQFKYYAERNKFNPLVKRLKKETLNTLQAQFVKYDRTFLITTGHKGSGAEMEQILTFLSEHAEMIWQDENFPDTKVWIYQTIDP